MHVLTDIVALLAVSLAAMLIAHKARLPLIIGLLVGGAIAGPNGLGLVTATEEVQLLAEVGVILLLFAIGLELSPGELGQSRKSLVTAGILQVLLTVVVGTLLAGAFGLEFPAAILLGFVLSLSSTAVALKLLQDRAELHAPQGRFALGIAIVQDIAVVPMLLSIPLLMGRRSGSDANLLQPLIGGLLLTALVVVLSRRVIPKLLERVAHTRSSELFLIAIVVLCLGIAWVSSLLGLSLALGAFLAGLAVSGTEYRHQAASVISPLREIFTGFFFAAVGMLIDLRFILSHPVTVPLLSLLVVVIKATVVVVVIMLLRHPLRTAILTGAVLAQVGEFAFVLSQAGVEQGLIAPDMFRLILAISALSMAMTPALFWAAPRLAGWAGRIRGISMAGVEGNGKEGELSDHLIIIGYGLNGKNLSRACRRQGSPYIVIEANPINARIARTEGDSVILGDATLEAALLQAGANRARTMVVAISDPRATRRIVAIAKQINPALHMIVRTRFVSELEGLYAAGADQVVPEEFETAIEIFVLVMRRQQLAQEEIDRSVAEIRADSYEAFRTKRSFPPANKKDKEAG